MDEMWIIHFSKEDGQEYVVFVFDDPSEQDIEGHRILTWTNPTVKVHQVTGDDLHTLPEGDALIKQ